MKRINENTVRIKIGGTWGAGAANFYLYIKKYKRRVGYRLDLRKYIFGYGWRNERSGTAKTVEEAINWVNENSWLHIPQDELRKAFEVLEGE